MATDNSSKKATETTKHTTNAYAKQWAKRALCEYCFRLVVSESIGQVRIAEAEQKLLSQLGSWSQHHACFLVKLIYRPSQLPSARKKVHSTIEKFVQWSKTTPDGSQFERYAARMYIYWVGLKLGTNVWEQFPQLAQTVSDELLERDHKREWNNEEIMQSPAAQFYQEVAYRDDPQLRRAEKIVQERVLDVISRGMPSVKVVKKLLGANAGENYRASIEEWENISGYMQGNSVDIDIALATGKELRWTEETASARVSLFATLCECGGDIMQLAMEVERKK